MLSHNQIFYSIFFILFTLFLLFIAKVSNIILPFVTGLLLAYFLGPLVLKLQKHLGSRVLASVVVLLCFILLLALFFKTLGPALKNELFAFAENLPSLIRSSVKLVEPYYLELAEQNKYRFFPDISNSIEKISSYVFSITAKLLQNIFHSSVALVNLASLIFITPIVTFYLIKDWEKGVNHIQNLIPRKQNKTVKRVFAEIDQIVSAYIRGQTTVCLVLGSFYAVALKIAGLKYGFLIGLGAGILSFIPYFGAFIGMSIGVIVSIFQFHSVSSSFIILAIFLFGQFIEGNFITPRIIGDKIGLHPVLIMFAVLAGGSLFGFTGILFAMPVSAVAKVVIMNLISAYKKSNFFRHIDKHRTHKSRTRKSHA